MENFTSNGRHDTRQVEDALAERSLLAAMLNHPSCIRQVVQESEGARFGFEAHNAIYRACVRFEVCGLPITAATIGAAVADSAGVAELGGVVFVQEVADAVYTLENVPLYVQMVREAATQRRLLRDLETARAAIQHGERHALHIALGNIRAMEEALEPRGTRFQPLTIGQIRARGVPQQLVEGLLPVTGLSVLFGQSGSFKSFMALDIGLHVAARRNWHGRQVRGGAVAYVAGEGLGGLGSRIEAWQQHHGAGDDVPFYTIPEAPQIGTEEESRALLAALRSLPEPPQLVILDTLARVIGAGDENSARDVGAVVAACGRIQHELGAAVMIVHHTGKSGEMRGSTALKGAADTCIEVRSDDPLVTLACEKQKDQSGFAPLTFKRQVIDLAHGSSLIFEPTAAVPVGRKLPHAQEVALNFLRHKYPEGASPELWQGDVIAAGIPDRTFRNARQKLK